MIRAVIFDIDGTLIDSVDLHTKAWQEAFEKFGKNLPFEKIRPQIGKGGDQLLPVFFTTKEIAEFGNELEKYRGEIFKTQYLPLVRPFPHVRALFQRVLADGKRIALASSAKKEEVLAYERIAQIEDLVDEKTSSEDGRRSKPHPDIIEAALDKLDNPAKENVLMVGDTPYDAIAANSAGIRCIGVLSGGFPREELESNGIVEIYDDPADLLAHYSDSLLGST